MHRVFDALVTAAAADVTGHRGSDLIVGRFRVLGQKCRRLHDLAHLAEAALRDIHLAPRLLNRVIAGGVEAFDGRDLPADDIVHRCDAGTYRLFVDHHGAGAAKRLAAAEFGAGQPYFVTQIPKQWKVRIAIPGLFLSVYLDFDHDRFLALFKLEMSLANASRNTFPFACVGRSTFPPGLGIGGWLTNLVARPIGLTVWVGLPPALSGWVTVDWRCEVNAIRNHVSSTSQGSILHHPFVKSGASPADGDFGKPSRSERTVFN